MSLFSRLLVVLLAVSAASLGTSWLVLRRAVERAAAAEQAVRAVRVASAINGALERYGDPADAVTRWAPDAASAARGGPLDAVRAEIDRTARRSGLDGWAVFRLGTRERLAEGVAAADALPWGGVADGDSWWEERAGHLVRCAARLEDLPIAPFGSGLALIGCRLVRPAELAGELGRRLAGDVRSLEVTMTPPGRATAGPDPEVVVVPLRGRRRDLAAVRAVLGAIGDDGVARRLHVALTGGIAAGAGVGLILAALLAASWIAPLRRLARAVDRITGRGLAPEPMPRAAGEIGRLARAIDRMIAALHQEQLHRRDAERQAAWREVARRVAHEVRNPLTPIRLAVDNLERAARRGPDALDRALAEEPAAIRAEVDRLERLVREFAEYSRLPAPDPRPVDLEPIVRRAVEGQVAGRERIAVRIRHGGKIPRVLADAELLSAALANLARNAAAALAERGGTITVTLGPARPGRVRLTIADDGPGIAPELFERIFEPYVTGGGGSGLGLAITRRIVEEHGGTIRAAPRQGGGTEFIVELPAVRDEPSANKG